MSTTVVGVRRLEPRRARGAGAWEGEESVTRNLRNVRRLVMRLGSTRFLVVLEEVRSVWKTPHLWLLVLIELACTQRR